MPPARAHDGEHAAGDDHPGQADDGQHTEHVDPRGHVGGLAIGQQTVGGKAVGGVPRPRRPLAGLAVVGTFDVRSGVDIHRLGSFRLGKGNTIARTNTAIIRRITTRLATEI